MVEENLDILSRYQETHQRITTAIVGKIEASNRKLTGEVSELLDFQTRHRLEKSFRGSEGQVRTLVADLVQGMWTQQRYVIVLKDMMQQNTRYCRRSDSNSLGPLRGPYQETQQE
jgi:hypothetical protein